MASIPKKAFFERQSSAYPNGDSVSYARLMGCDSIALLRDTWTPDKHARARAAGLRVWLWDGPSAWMPETWRATHDGIVSILRAHPAEGYIADVETAREWTRAPRAELDALIGALDRDSKVCSVGLTSFPSWPFAREVAVRCPQVWGCPQLYGVVTPGTPAELRARGESWRAAFRGGYCPALAAWSRPAPELAAYLAAFVGVPGAIFWHGLPAPRSYELEVLRRWEPHGSGGSALWLVALFGLLLAMRSTGSFEPRARRSS